MVKALVERLKGDVPVIQEIARNVMEEKGYSRIDVDSTDPERRFAMQHDIFHAQLEKEDSYLESGTNFVSDRSAIDPLVYLMHYSGTKSLDKMTSGVEWRKVRERYGDTKESLVVLLLPVDEFLIDDHIRYMAKSIQDWHSLAASFQRFLHEQDISAIEFGEERRDIGNRVDRVLTELRKS
jgi:hypothetical protein